MKKKITFLILIIIFIGITLCGIGYAVNSKPSFSYIDERMSEYFNTGKWSEENIPSVFSEDSAEIFFLKGMKCYADGDFRQAEQYFKEAEKRPYRDSALPAYLNIYLNQCQVQQTKSGKTAYVENALDAIAGYPDLSNYSHWVWELIYSVTEDGKTDVTAQKLLKQYKENAGGLKKEKVLLLDAYSAILKNITGQYSESIILFYDTLHKVQDMPDSYDVIKVKSICINYIGDMYYAYEDYERAYLLYQELIEQPIDDPYENADLKYPAYINVGNICLKQKDFEQARKIVSETMRTLPYLPEDMAKEISAFLYNILANIELEKNNLNGAQTYFERCRDFLDNHQSTAFFDTKIYFGLTQCKILKKSGDLGQAERLLNEMLDGVIIEDKMKYEVRKMLTDIYCESGQESKYLKEQDLLLKEQNDRMKQYQSDYCEVIDYYDQLLNLRKEHTISVQRNETLIAVLLVSLLLLICIIKLSITRYHDSMTDSLSGLYNRKQLEKELAFYDKNSHKLMSYGIIMTDIDFFKKYNDTYGHAAGDTVIRQVSETIKKSVRSRDIVIRYGGEEFLILLKDINSSTIESIAERIRLSVESAQILHKTSDCNDHVTLSLGCFYVKDTSLISLSDAIKEADKALYESKQKGRNTVTIL